MFAKRLLVIVTGAAISAFGMSLALGAQFGGATLAILWQGVSRQTGLSIGTSSLLIALLMLAFVFFYDRRQIHIGTLLYQAVYSAGLDGFALLHRYPEARPLQALVMVLGITVFAAGAGMYASADLGRGPYEALTFALAGKNRWQVKYVRMVEDAVCIVLGWLLGGSVGLCTAVTLLLSGPIIQWVNQLCRRWFRF